VDNVIVAWGMTALVMAITVDRLFERVKPSLLGAGFRTTSAGECDFLLVHPGSRRRIALLQMIGHPSVRCFVRTLFLCLGQHLFVVPAITGDLYGSKWATTNYGVVYTARDWLPLRGPGAAWLFAKTGSWNKVFLGHDHLRSDRCVHGVAVAEPLAKRSVQASDRAAAPAVDMTVPAKA